MAAEAERVRDRRQGPAVAVAERARRVGHVVEVEPLIGLPVADRRRRDPVPQRLDRGDGLDASGGAEQVADRRFGRGDRDLGPLAEDRLDRVGFGAVVERGRGAVGVYVVDLGGLEPGVREGDLDRPRRSRASGLGRGQVVGVRGRSVADDLGRAAGRRAPPPRPPPRTSGCRRPRPSRSRRGGGRRGGRCRSPTSHPCARTPPWRAGSGSPPRRRRGRRSRRRPRSPAPRSRSHALPPRRPRSCRRSRRESRGASPPRRRPRCPSSAERRAARSASGRDREAAGAAPPAIRGRRFRCRSRRRPPRRGREARPPIRRSPAPPRRRRSRAG